MKKINVLILFVLCFLLSGCSATYTMTIDSSISDKLEISMSDKEYNDFNSDPNNYLIVQYANQANAGENFSGEKISGVDYYDMERDDSLKKVVFSSDFENDKVDQMALVKNVYRNYTLRRTSDELYLKTNVGFDFPYDELTSVKVILESPYKVLNSNADLVEGNKLIWNITKANSESSYIEVNYATDMNFDEEINITDEDVESDDNENTIVDDNEQIDESNDDVIDEENDGSVGKVIGIIVLVIVLVGGIIAFVILKNKNNNLNKI